VIKETAPESKPWSPPRVVPPKGARQCDLQPVEYPGYAEGEYDQGVEAPPRQPIQSCGNVALDDAARIDHHLTHADASSAFDTPAVIASDFL